VVFDLGAFVAGLLSSSGDTLSRSVPQRKRIKRAYAAAAGADPARRPDVLLDHLKQAGVAGVYLTPVSAGVELLLRCYAAGMNVDAALAELRSLEP